MVYTEKDLNTLKIFAWLDEKPAEIKEVPAPKQEKASLDTNILTLSNKLRSSGFDKYADQLENKFLAVKQAEVHLYKVHEETGEDLVNAAHPDGDNKTIAPTKGSDLGDIETILSRHKKIEDIVNKKPTGKLASLTSYVDQCKIVLGEVPKTTTDEEFNNAILKAMGTIKTNLTRIGELCDKELTFKIAPTYIDPIIAWTEHNDDQGTPAIGSLRTIKDDIEKLRSRLDPNGLLHIATFGMSGVSEDTWLGIDALLKESETCITNAISWRKQLRQQEAKEEIHHDEAAPTSVAKEITETTLEADPLIGIGANLINTLKAYQFVSNVTKNPNAVIWIPKQIKEIQDVMKRYNGAAATEKLDSVKSSLESEMQEKQKEVTDFANTIVNANNVKV